MVFVDRHVVAGRCVSFAAISRLARLCSVPTGGKVKCEVSARRRWSLKRVRRGRRLPAAARANKGLATGYRTAALYYYAPKS